MTEFSTTATESLYQYVPDSTPHTATFAAVSRRFQGFIGDFRFSRPLRFRWDSQRKRLPPSLAVQGAPVNSDAEVETTMAELARQKRGGVLDLPSIFIVTHREAIIALAARHQLPAVYSYSFFAEAGGLCPMVSTSICIAARPMMSITSQGRQAG
jgi:hypothetical protein